LSNNAALGPASAALAGPPFRTDELPNEFCRVLMATGGTVCLVVTPPWALDVITGTTCPFAASGGDAKFPLAPFAIALGCDAAADAPARSASNARREASEVGFAGMPGRPPFTGGCAPAFTVVAAAERRFERGT
jgi:hypothetical protein